MRCLALHLAPICFFKGWKYDDHYLALKYSKTWNPIYCNSPFMLNRHFHINTRWCCCPSYEEELWGKYTFRNRRNLLYVYFQPSFTSVVAHSDILFCYHSTYTVTFALHFIVVLQSTTKYYTRLHQHSQCIINYSHRNKSEISLWLLCDGLVMICIDGMTVSIHKT